MSRLTGSWTTSSRITILSLESDLGGEQAAMVTWASGLGNSELHLSFFGDDVLCVEQVSSCNVGFADHRGEEDTEPEGNVLDSPVNICTKPPSMTMSFG